MRICTRALCLALVVATLLPAPAAQAEIGTNTSLADIRAPALTPAPIAAAPVEKEFSIWRSVGALLLVLGGLLALTRVLKTRYGGSLGIAADRRLKMVERLSLGQKQHLVLVRVDQRELLIAITADRITTLSNLEPAASTRLNPGDNA